MYPGGKNGPGVYQTIINQIPPHRIYIEPFAGSAAIYRHKRRADISYLIEKDPTAAAALEATAARDVEYRRINREAIAATPPARARGGRSTDGGRQESNTPVAVICADAADFFRSYKFTGGEFVYADPPYLAQTRRAGDRRQIYRQEIQSADAHSAMLDWLSVLPCNVMISGYWSELYGRRLEAWRLVRFNGMNRGGHRTGECLWMNYSEPVALHDYSYLGKDSRERQDVKRMKARWVQKLERMPVIKRQAILAAISETQNRAGLTLPQS